MANNLTDSLRKINRGDFFMTHQEIADALGIHRVSVVTIEKRALVKLAKSPELREYWMCDSAY